jgi:hypothetical protein
MPCKRDRRCRRYAQRLSRLSLVAACVFTRFPQSSVWWLVLSVNDSASDDAWIFKKFIGSEAIVLWIGLSSPNKHL